MLHYNGFNSCSPVKCDLFELDHLISVYIKSQNYKFEELWNSKLCDFGRE